MKIKRASILKIGGMALTIILLAGLFLLRTLPDFGHRDYLNTNFFTFWLPGHMVLTGQNPYDQAQYLAGHYAAGETWIPNKIFPYPLPLSLFMIPLGLLPLSSAFLVWQLASLVIIAITIFALLSLWKGSAHQRLLVPMTAMLLFFGPEYLTLNSGTLGAFFLLIAMVSLFLFEKEKPIPAGFVLSLTMLKPSQGLTILLLAGIWMIARKDWKAILGTAMGGLAMLVVGLIQDPQWVVKFIGAGQAVMDRSQGLTANVWAFSYLVCQGTSPCSTLLGGGSALILLGLGALFIGRHRASLSAWEVFNIIIPIGFVSTVYLWSYDQILYVIPIIWIAATLVERKKSYRQAFVFLVLTVLVSIITLTLFSATRTDLWSLGNTLIILGMVFWLILSKKRGSPGDSSEITKQALQDP
jgi:hypothetical protein